MLQPPKRTKYRKMMKGRNRGKFAEPQIRSGEYALQSSGYAFLNARQIEAVRRVLTRYFKRTGKILIRIFPDKPITKKPLEVRQGKGKGNVEYYVAVIRPGMILFEISEVSQEEARQAFKLAAAKLPLATRFVTHGDLSYEQE